MESFSENNVEFASPVEKKGHGFGNDDLAFSEIYHKLIHSPALKTLLQLEHTYALAVSEVCKARDNAREIMQKRYTMVAREMYNKVCLVKCNVHVATLTNYMYPNTVDSR